MDWMLVFVASLIFLFRFGLGYLHAYRENFSKESVRDCLDIAVTGANMCIMLSILVLALVICADYKSAEGIHLIWYVASIGQIALLVGARRLLIAIQTQ